MFGATKLNPYGKVLDSIFCYIVKICSILRDNIFFGVACVKNERVLMVVFEVGGGVRATTRVIGPRESTRKARAKPLANTVPSLSPRGCARAFLRA